MPYHKSLLESFIWFSQQMIPLQTLDTVLSTLPVPVAIMRQHGNFQQAGWLFAIHIAERLPEVSELGLKLEV